jgi:hypothetical protein
MQGDVKGTHEQRFGANEAMFREVNEAIERGQWPGEVGSTASFRCECARLGCTRIIELTVEEYEEVRAHSRRFVVAIGHQQPEVERVVEERPAYLVVEKRDQAGEVAEATDPRR